MAPPSRPGVSLSRQVACGSLSPRTRLQRGMSLVELLVALVVIGIGGAATIEAIRFAHGANLKAAYLQAASVAAQNAFEQRRANTTLLSPGTTVTTPVTGLPEQSSAVVTVSTVPGRPGLWSVQVEVTWTAGGPRGALSGRLSEETLIYAP